jgi:cobalt-zinc-cadmium efflux system outer membrane protein
VRQAVEKLLQKELSVDAAVQIALLNNPSLQATYEELGVSQADVVEAGLLENPVFTGSARFPNEPPLGTNFELGVVGNFLNILMLPARKKFAAAHFEKTKMHVADEVLGLATQVRKSYYETLGAKQMAEMGRLKLRAAQASYEMAGRLHEAGNFSDLDLAREQGQYEQARVILSESEAKVLAAREHLNRLMGLWGHQIGWRMPERLPDIPEKEISLEHLESLAVANRLDLAVAGQEMEILAQALGITIDWRWIAAAEIGVSSERDTDGQWVVGPMLSLELPIFNQRDAKIARLEARLRQSQQEMASLAVTIRSEVRSHRDRLLMTRNLINHYKDVLIPLRARIVELTQAEYNFMLAGVFELLVAKREEFDAYQGYVRAVRDYWIIRAELQRTVGGRLLPSAGDPALAPGKKSHPPSADKPKAVHGDHRAK